MISLSKPFLARILGLLVILLLGGLILAFPAYQFARKAALDHLLKESQQYSSEGETRLAFQKAYRAHQLFPDSDDAKLALARSSLDYPHQNTPQFWAEVLDSPNRTPEDLNKYVNYLLDSFQLDRAFRLMERLYQELPEDEDVHRIYIQSLIRNRKYHQVVNLVNDLTEDGYETVYNYENLYAALWAIDTEDSRSAALKLLYNNSLREDAVGASAARRMLGLEVSTPEGQVKLAKRLIHNPEASKDDILFGLNYLQKLEAIPEDQVRERIEQTFDLQDSDDLYLLSQWRLKNEQYDQILQMAPAEVFMQNSRTSRIYHRALISSGKAQHAYENTLTTDRDPGLNQVDRLLIRAQAQIQLGRMDEFEESLNLAVEQASINHFSELEQALFEVNAWSVADKLYERVLEIEGLESIGYQKMIWSKYLQGNEYELLKYLQDVELTDYREEPPVLAFLAYLKLLFSENPVETKFYLEELITKYPNVQDFQLIQAFSFYLDGNISLAWKLARNLVKPTMEQGSRYQRLILYLIAHQAGYEGELTPLIRHLSTGNLLASESRLLNDIGRAGSNI